MSNTINNLLTNEKITTSNGSSPTEQTVKDKPSLFDSLLTTTSPTQDSEIKSDSKVEEVEDPKNKIDVNKIVETEDIKSTENKIDIEEKIENKEVKVSGTVTSLLDRLVIEAKSDIKVINKEEVDKLNKIENSLLTTTSPAQDSEIKSDFTVEEVENPKNKIDVNKIVETEDIKSTENKTENKIDIEEKIENKEVKVSGAVTSLLDRLVIEAKSDIKVINKEEVDKSNKIENSLLTITSPTQESEIKSDSTVEEVVKTGNKIEIEGEIDNKEVKEPLLKIVEEKKEVLVTNIIDKVLITNKEEMKTVEVKEELKTIINNNDIKNLNTQTTIDESTVVSLPSKENIDKEVLNNSNLLNTNAEKLTIENDTSMVEEGNTNKLEITNLKKDEKLSLMDQLILKNSEKASLDIINPNLVIKELVPKDLISSIYLGSQKNLMNNQSLFNKNEAVSLLKEGTSIQAVKTSAEMLELGLEDINVEQTVEVEKVEVKKSNIDMVDRKNLIDSILSQKNVRSEEIKGLITKSVEASNALIENSITLADDVNVNINSPLSYNIQSKIIGAKQQMSTMMSDIAKQMYENYKPPVTVFKINLNPLELGSIAILMKSDKNNGLSISMNVSNNSTLEALMENQNVLRNSLNKTFDENTRFNLDFNSSNQNSDNQSSNNQSSQNNNGRFEQQMDTQSVLQLKEENKDREEKSIDYM